MQTAAMTSHAALMDSPRLNATTPSAPVPRLITPAHRSLVRMAEEMPIVVLIAFPPRSCKPRLRHHLSSACRLPFARSYGHSHSVTRSVTTPAGALDKKPVLQNDRWPPCRRK